MLTGTSATPSHETLEAAEDAAFWWRIRAQVINLRAAPFIYADWTASGRLFRPIEERLTNIAGPYMANTHTEDSLTGRTMTEWLQQAEARIKAHVNAGPNDVLISTGSGMTGALGKLIRMMGWWAHEHHKPQVLAHWRAAGVARPLVYITHREHHSNHTMWLESLAEVRMIPVQGRDEIDLAWLAEDLAREPRGRVKMASVTAASNVTGVRTPYGKIAGLMHDHGGLCFVDFAASAPYDVIDMHPSERESLDAIFFSPHKFLGGPGSQGVLVFAAKLYNNRVPEQPGGGTVIWTNPWGEHRFVSDIQSRENGGTPGILQTLKTALAIELKETMGSARIQRAEARLNARFFERLAPMKNVQLLAPEHTHRLSVFSLVFTKLHYKTAVRLLSQHFGVQARGGCACAGTYGHILLGIDRCASKAITNELDKNASADKPGWVRISFHPSQTLAEVDAIADAVAAVANMQPQDEITGLQVVEDLWASLV
ncbi:aminotransferase class V-fold PLP-dependent enzyme [Simiduia sp. 21SJ11W-1]|uniref:aminotransferase class V-fold PLP-dependent enzyme n=1 Tax=Simiduia sp. 21SJ11W-1 TaxID=2909669 RepID=UPI00209E0DBC|nr:aminotransferase class V-fold PLP-dependent enzyme [Simiduia sp. 21SJ11W-1]UTA46735.1 aminotransferase class V-fold PLP-dependent enzyme [Simiduia sp. 21SJ11W-1]